MRIRSATASHVGRIRSQNQDRVVARDDLGLYAVLDGMGGGPAGEVAAELARDGLVSSAASMGHGLSLEERVRQAVLAAGAAVALGALHRPDRARTGTTVVAALVDPASGRAALAHAGDSRAYLRCTRTGAVRRLTHDHCVAQEMLDRGCSAPTGSTGTPPGSRSRQPWSGRARTRSPRP